MELFSSQSGGGEPLAYRMRPRTLEEFIGQEHIVGPGRLLRRVIQADQLSSVIFSGPPGTGKTTLARVIANTTKSLFITINAVLSGVKDLREALEEARNTKDLYGRRTILFIDEVHRWNKAQQDALLPWVEKGTVILIGATTENPFFEVNSALVSRSRVFQLKPLSEENLRAIISQALEDPVRGYGRYRVNLLKEAEDHLIQVSGGDARSLLNALELAVETTPEKFPPPEGEEITITLETAEQSIQRKAVLYDKEGDCHFDTISAFIKSLRGSDPDAALYWLARMVYAGEDPRFIFRRMLILASEDVGLADPAALSVVTSAASAFDRVGLPEGRFHLAQAALYLANAKKSNSALGFFDALAAVEAEFAEDVPSHLKDANRDKKGFGHGEGYLYPHAFKDHWTAQQYLPRGLSGRIFYQPSDSGWEGAIKKTVDTRRELQLEAALREAPPEILTFSPDSKGKDSWLKRIEESANSRLSLQREKLFEGVPLTRHSRILDLRAGTGFLIWEALRRTPEGGVWGLVSNTEEEEIINHYAQRLPGTERPVILRSAIKELRTSELLEKKLFFELILGRNIFTSPGFSLSDAETFSPLLAPEGRISLCEVLPGKSTRLSSLALELKAPAEAYEALIKTEALVYSPENSVIMELDKEKILTALEKAGLCTETAEEQAVIEPRRIGNREAQAWFGEESAGAFARALRKSASPAAREALRSWAGSLLNREIPWQNTLLYIKAKKKGRL